MVADGMHGYLGESHSVLGAQSVGVFCQRGKSAMINNYIYSGSMAQGREFIGDVPTFGRVSRREGVSCSVQVENVSSLSSSTWKVPSIRVGLHTHTS